MVSKDREMSSGWPLGLDRDMSSGWPLGLEIMNMRLRVSERLQAATAAQPYSIHLPSASFSSFSSSNLDTESTASFFQDHSVPLGRLIGIRSGDTSGSLYFPNRIRHEEHEKAALTGAQSNIVSRGICIPLLLSVVDKMSRRRNSKQSN